MNSDSQNMPDDMPAAPLHRRLFAILYDMLLLLAILFIAASLATALNRGQAIDSEHALYPLFVGYLLLISFIYFGWFWVHGGQTLGMKTWRLLMISNGGAGCSWKQAGLRFASAILSWACVGLGYILSLASPQRLTWHDRLSNSRLIDIR